MNMNNWNSTPVDDFWKVADELQERTLQRAESLFSLAEVAEPGELISLLVQYRFFTIYYTTDLAILVARLKDGALRSFIAELLFDELGQGSPLKAHPRLYDDFLRSIGVTGQDLDSLAIGTNIKLLDAVRKNLSDSNASATYGVGLRGMGGECVCQIYLARLYEHVIKNPYIQHMKSDIDWRFWDLHVGPHDVEHRHRTRAIIHDEVVVRGPEALVELGRGYQESMTSWGAFWTNVMDSAMLKRAQRVRVAV
jgi:hypothetical protein